MTSTWQGRTCEKKGAEVVSAGRFTAADLFSICLVILFFENLDNVFRVDTNRVGLTKLKNDVEISWRAKLAWFIEGVLLAVGQANCKGSKGMTL
jgi:hypothetical protein